MFFTDIYCEIARLEQWIMLPVIESESTGKLAGSSAARFCHAKVGLVAAPPRSGRSYQKDTLFLPKAIRIRPSVE
jgi:hypothetical protein